MWMDFLGKILLPNQPGWLLKKKMHPILLVVLASIVFGTIVAAFMWISAYKKPTP
jgi:hypothetical protein